MAAFSFINPTQARRQQKPAPVATKRGLKGSLMLEYRSPAGNLPPATAAPPHNLEAELEAIGAMLTDPAAAAKGAELLEPADFYRQFNRIVFDCMATMHRKGEPVDFITVGEELRRCGQLEDAGGAAYLQACIEGCASTANFEAYADIVRSLSHKREAARLAEEAHHLALNGAAAPDAVEKLQRGVNELASKAKPKAAQLQNFTGASLLEADFPEPKMVVAGLVPEGLSILGGNPKLGKSWLMLGIGVAVATSGRALGSIEVEGGDVLYLALEDNPRRLKSRLQKVLAGDRPEGLHRLHLFAEWERMNQGGYERLSQWLIAHPETRLVVVDTLQKVKARSKSSGNLYEDDYDSIGQLKQLADRHAVAIVVVHHLRKADGTDPVEAISGTYGLSGAADGLLVLKRERGRADATLFVTGRDMDDSENALKWDGELGLWHILGDAAEYRLTTQRAEVADAMRAIGKPVTPKVLWETAGVGKSFTNLKTLLWRMAQDNELASANGSYSLLEWCNPCNPCNPSNPSNESNSSRQTKAARRGVNAPDSEPYGSVTPVTPVTAVTPVTPVTAEIDFTEEAEEEGKPALLDGAL